MKATRQLGEATTTNCEMYRSSTTSASTRPHLEDVRCGVDQCGDDSSMKMRLGEVVICSNYALGFCKIKDSPASDSLGHEHLKLCVEIVFIRFVGITSDEYANTTILFQIGAHWVLLCGSPMA
jgi:hypothetical protein